MKRFKIYILAGFLWMVLPVAPAAMQGFAYASDEEIPHVPYHQRLQFYREYGIAWGNATPKQRREYMDDKKQKEREDKQERDRLERKRKREQKAIEREKKREQELIEKRRREREKAEERERREWEKAKQELQRKKKRLQRR